MNENNDIELVFNISHPHPTQPAADVCGSGRKKIDTQHRID